MNEEQLVTVTLSTTKRRQAERQWRDAIVRAHLAGHSYREISKRAGVHFTRISQIFHEERSK